MSDNIYKVNANLPLNDKIKLLNDMILTNEGEIDNAQFDVNEIANLYVQIGLSRRYLRNVALGNTLTDYSDWTHYVAENGYSIWQIAPDNYVYNSVNKLYFDGTTVVNMGEANSLSSTFDSVFSYNDTYTDNTTEAGTEGGTAFTLMTELTTAWVTINDALFIGLDSTFSGAKFEFATRGANYTLRIGYYSGDSGAVWTELDADINDLVDGTSNFTSNGLISWTIPDDWELTTLNGEEKYWIRIETSTTPLVNATCYYLIPGTSVQGLLALSTSEIQQSVWKWCTYDSKIYTTIRNIGDSSYEGSYYILSTSSATNLKNFFIYNHIFTSDYEDSRYAISDISAIEATTVSFLSEYDNGTKSIDFLVDFNEGQKQKVLLDASVTVTLSAPGVGHYQLKVIQDDSVGSRVITWGTTIKWANGTAPTLTTDTDGIDFVNLYYDGSEWFGQASLDFS